MDSFASLLNDIRDALIFAAPSMPAQAWGVTGIIVAILVIAAVVDGLTALVPEPLIFLGLFLVTASRGFLFSWDSAAHYLTLGIAAALLIWALNFAWVRKFGYDAIGMGDAKATMLVVACFGVAPAVFAWGLGSVLATILIALSKVTKYPVAKVTFLPFLIVGLGVALIHGGF